MNAQMFLENFGYIANAPEGVKRLREMILQLAVTAALTISDPKYSKADVLFRQNQEHRKHLTQKKMLRKQKPIPLAVGHNIPWIIPESWKWCRLGEVTNYGSTEKAEYKDVGSETWVLELEDIEKDTSRILSKVRAKDRKFLSSKNRFAKGQVLYGKLRPYLDKVVIADEDGVCTTEIMPILPFEGIMPEYLRWYLKTPYFKSYANNSAHGMNLPRLGTDPARTALFALPPIEEQKRIVAKVDELMALCDKLVIHQQERERRFPVLSRASHARFVAAPTKTNFKAIFDKIETICPEDLRKTILTLAAYGKLVPQQLEDEPAQLLIERIAKQRDDMLSIGYPNESESRTQIKKQQGQKLPDHLPHLPSGWAWATLMQISLLVVDCHNKTAPYVSEGIRLLRTTNIRNGQLNLNEPKFVTEQTYEKWSARCKPEPGDILITREAPMGEVCIIPEGMKICMGQRMMLIRLCPDTIDIKFLLYSLMEPGLMDRVQNKPIGATVKHLRVGGVETLLIPVAPVAEQQRIVAKIDQLMAIVDRLEKLQNKKNKIAESFAQASVVSITGTQIKEQKKMKAPKTELITKLQVGSKPRPTDKSPLANLIANSKGELSAKSLWQQSGMSIDAFYQQLKTEMANGWISEPEKAIMKEMENG